MIALVGEFFAVQAVRMRSPVQLSQEAKRSEQPLHNGHARQTKVHGAVCVDFIQSSMGESLE